jgi:hypothetical protein
MTVELSEQDIGRIVEALDHVSAYHRSQNRDDRVYQEIADRLQALKKPPVSITGTSRRTKSR